MAARQCPYCDQPTDSEHCEVHGVPTVEADLFERPPAPIQKGATIAGRYRVERFLAEGGFGAVWVARQLAMNRTVALKVLRRADRRGTDALKRFYREALTISRLAHPNVVQVFDFGVDRESRVPFIVFELLDGRTLTDVVAKHGALAEKHAVGIMVQVARALVEAHAQGIVHRDLKPNNVMVTKLRDGSRHVKVLDFGLAKIQEDGDDALTGITAPGALLGAPHFMSPEQAAGARVDHRSDLYTFGCLLHSLVAARPPFHSAQAADLIAAHLNQPPPPLPMLAGGVAPSQALVVLHRALLAKNPLERPANASVVAEILNALADGEPIDARATLEAARKQAFAGAIPQQDTFASNEELTALVDPEPAADDASTTAPPAPIAPGRTDARRRIAEVETVPPVHVEALAPLSLSAATISPRRRKRTLALAAAALALGLAGGAILAVGSEEPVQPIESPPPPSLPIAEATVEPKLRRIRIASEPMGAEIWMGGSLAGVTPQEIELAPDTTQFELRLAGHHTQTVAIDERSEISVTLQKKRTRVMRRPKPAEPPPPAKRPYPVW